MADKRQELPFLKLYTRTSKPQPFLIVKIHDGTS